MHLSYLLLLTGSVIGVMAHPSSHAHANLHRAAHDKRAPGKKTFVKNVHPKFKLNKPTSSSSSSSSEPPAAPTVAIAAVPPAAPTVQAPASATKGPASYIPFCSEGNTVKAKRVTAEQVHYVGNTGMAGNCPWNSNMMLVPNEAASLYMYRQKYTNVAKENYEVVCFNKIGPTGKLTGMFDVPEQSPLRFMLAPGETKTVVTQENTQMTCAFSPGKIQKTPLGQFAGNWAETDSGNTSNNKWSGGDCSSLVAQAYGMDVPGCKMCSNDTGNGCSIIKPGAQFHENAYIKGMEAEDGVGLNIPAGGHTINIEVGYS